MRIGVDVRSLLDRPHAGVGEYTAQLIRALLDVPGADQYVLFSNSMQRSIVLPSAWPRERYRLVEHRMPNKFLNLSLAALGRPTLRQLVGAVDLFFAPNHNFLPLPMAMPFVLTVHDLSFHHFPHLFSPRRRLWHHLVRPRRLLRAADGIVAVSQATAEDVQQSFGIAAERIAVIPSGVSSASATNAAVAAIRQRYQIAPQFLFSLSTLEPRKNLLTLLDAYTLLRRRGYAGDLVIAGASGWSQVPLQRAVRAHPFRSAIHMLSYVSNEERAALYCGADLFLYPSLYEGFGFPPLEALLAGTPVVTGHHSSLPEVVGEDAMMVDVYNVAEVAEAAWHVLADATARSRLAGRRVVLKERFSWQRAAAQTRVFFQQVYERYHAHRH